MDPHQDLTCLPEDCSKFSYQPFLNEGCFRLLKLHPGQGRMVTCEVFEAPLDNCQTEFEAVSYCWGQRLDADKVLVPHHVEPDQYTYLGVTLSLSSILRDLRHPTEPRILWIDALCINQTDVAERSAQVQRMGDIYRTACRVLFCVGRPTQETDLLFNVAETLQEFAQSQKCETDKPDLIDCYKAIKSQLESKHFCLEARLAEAMLYIFAQLWFYRIWIIQEVFNAQDALVYCGQFSMPSAVFVEIVSILDPKPPPHCRNIINMMPATTGFMRQTERRPLHSLIVELADSKATDQRDKIFALLELCSDEQAKVTLRPDYAKSEKAIMRDVISYICGCRVADDTPIPWDGIEEFLSAQAGDYNRIYYNSAILLLNARDGTRAGSLLQIHGARIQLTPELIILAAKQSTTSVMAWLERQPDFEQSIQNCQSDELARATASAVENGHQTFLCRLLELGKWPDGELNFDPGVLERKLKNFDQDLIQRHIEPNLRPAGLKPLPLAAYFGLSSLARTIIAKDGHSRFKANGLSLEECPTLIAAIFGNDMILGILIENGINVHTVAGNGLDAMDYAIKARQYTTIKLLAHLEEPPENGSGGRRRRFKSDR